MSNEKTRLKAIKERKINSNEKCDSCGKNIKGKEVWVVNRYGTNGEVLKYYYCKECFPTREDVLNEIDTDEILYGIAFVDDFRGYVKKDYRRLHECRRKLYGK